MGTTHFGNDRAEFFNLLLGARQRTETLLGEFSGTLILAVLEQFHDTALVRGEAGNFSDEAADELSALCGGLTR